METKAHNNIHPVDHVLCTDLLPSVWCAGCGIGTVVYSFIEAVRDAGIDQDRLQLLTGSGCTSHVTDYLRMRSKRSKNRYLMDLASDMQLAEPDSHVVVFMNNSDLLISGAEDLAHAIRRGARIVVIHVNNILYIMTNTGPLANTPYTRPSWDGNFQLPFNMPHLAISYGANYVARWTPLHAGWLKYSIAEAFAKKGVALIEVVAPCLLYEATGGSIGYAIERIKFYDSCAVMKSNAPLQELDIRESKYIAVGEIFDGGYNE
jgi:2-oxoglutarate ferredoxin oxidoreductase subunit beta